MEIWISNVAKRVKLNSAFWICAVLGVFGLIISNSLSNGFFSSAGDDLILPSFLLLCAAAGFLIYYIAINTTNEYGLCIESNSGSIEIYTNYNRQILDNAQSQLEAGIMALKKGTTYNITYDLSTGQISNDIIIHGTNYGSAITGQGNTATK